MDVTGPQSVLYFEVNKLTLSLRFGKMEKIFLDVRKIFDVLIEIFFIDIEHVHISRPKEKRLS